MRCARARPPRARPHVSVWTSKQKPQQLMSHRLLKRLSLCHLVMQALVMKTLMSSQSMSSESHTLLIRKDGSVSTAIDQPPAKLGIDDAMCRSIFGSSDESDEPSPKRRRSEVARLGR
uniref:Uncharacterized protein n=1 Tax=Peronospora matthiolae TaxID=2874970 RepID=A0AAV1V772_9STRA